MKLFFLLFILLFLNPLNAKQKELNIVLYGINYTIASQKTIKRIFKKIFYKNEAFKDYKLNIETYESSFNIKKRLEDTYNPIDVLYTNSYDYINNYMLFHKMGKDFSSLRSNDRKYESYYILANKNSKIKSIKDIKDKKIFFYSGEPLANVWFDYLSLKENKKPYKSLVKKNIQINSSLYKKVLDIYFNKIDLAVISETTWSSIVQLDPSIKKKIKIIKKSPKIFPTIISFFNKNSKKNESIKLYQDFIYDKKNKEYIENLLFLLKLETIEKMQDDEFKDAAEFFLEYKSLKNTNRVK